jgi:hypothetical protein
MTGDARKPKKAYRPPRVRSERILVNNLFASEGQGCEPNCDVAPPEPDA